MYKVVIGSQNPVKYEAVQQAFDELRILNETLTLNVDSGVSKQPLSDKETIKGALQRAKHALMESEADIAVGLEGGVVFGEDDEVMVCNWGALVDKEGHEFIAGGARIPLPSHFKEALIERKELGDLMDEYCQKKDIRKHEGALGIFTHGAVTRAEMFKHVSKLLIGQWQYSKYK